LNSNEYMSTYIWTTCLQLFYDSHQETYQLNPAYQSKWNNHMQGHQSCHLEEYDFLLHNSDTYRPEPSSLKWLLNIHW
jgi:hypothetical protein